MSQQISRQSIGNYYIDPNASITNHGDSSINGTIAWALNQVNVLGGGIVYLAPGDYNITESLVIPDNNIQIIGSGKDTRIILDQAVNDDVFIDVNVRTNIVLKNFQLYGSGGNVSSYPAIIGIFNISENSNLTIENIYFNTLTEGAVDLTNLSFSNITNCMFESIDSTSCVILTSSIHNNICNNIFKSITFEGIKLDSSSNNNVINNNIKFLSDFNSGIFLNGDCKYNNILENIIDGNEYDVTYGLIYCDGGLSYVSNNNINNNVLSSWISGTAGSGTGIHISSSVLNNIFGNVIDGLIGNGIELVSSCDYNNVSENQISYLVDGCGIKLTASSTYNKLTNNNIYSLTGVTCDGINLIATSDYNIITDNSINTVGRYGINVVNVNCEYNVICKNEFSACVTADVLNAGAYTKFELSIVDSVTPAHVLKLKSVNTGIVASKILTLDTANGDRTLKFSGNLDVEVASVINQDLSSDHAPQFIGINDQNDNEAIKITSTGSAVNEVTVINAPTNNPPELQASGGDTNIDLKLSGKATGGVIVYKNAFVNCPDTGDYTCTTATLGKSLRFGSASDRVILLPSVGVNEDGCRLTIIKPSGVGKLTIDAADSDYIDDSSAGGTIYTTDVGASLTIEYVHATTMWVILSGNKTWTTT